MLGLLLRSGKRWLAMFVTSAFYSVVHFLKSSDQPATTVTWTSGFNAIAHAFGQFREPMLVAAGFTTLFLIGWVLAEARLRTRSLWSPIGLHAGWIFGRGVLQAIARRQFIVLPWLGRSLLVGIVPLALVSLTWILMRAWSKYVDAPKT